MSTTYDPNDPVYLDRADLDVELDRVFDLCQGCRMCLGYCDAFPALFDAVDRHDGEASRLSRAERDAVVDACFQCKICTVRCPYVPPHEWMLDFARLMQRARAQRAGEEPVLAKARITDMALGAMDLTGPLGSALAPVANRALRVGSPMRMVAERYAGIAASRRLPTYARQRLSSWFRARLAPWIPEPVATVALDPTCFVEYMEPRIGKAAVAVYERLGVRVRLPERVRCCGAPWLHQGNLAAFRRAASRVVADLVRALDAGAEAIVVAQPTCGYVIRRDYPDYLATEDARRVAAATRDVSEFLVELVRQGRVELPAPEHQPGQVTYHAACHVQAQGVGLRGRDLLRSLGAEVRVVTRCSGIDGTWGWRAENQATSVRMGERLGSEVGKAGTAQIVGDCHLANTVIEEQVGRGARHPIELVADVLGVAQTTVEEDA